MDRSGHRQCHQLANDLANGIGPHVTQQTRRSGENRPRLHIPRSEIPPSYAAIITPSPLRHPMGV
jgi:hypothetical protein